MLKEQLFQGLNNFKLKNVQHINLKLNTCAIFDAAVKLDFYGNCFRSYHVFFSLTSFDQVAQKVFGSIIQNQNKPAHFIPVQDFKTVSKRVFSLSLDDA